MAASRFPFLAGRKGTLPHNPWALRIYSGNPPPHMAAGSSHPHRRKQQRIKGASMVKPHGCLLIHYPPIFPVQIFFRSPVLQAGPAPHIRLLLHQLQCRAVGKKHSAETAHFPKNSHRTGHVRRCPANVSIQHKFPPSFSGNNIRDKRWHINTECLRAADRYFPGIYTASAL